MAELSVEAVVEETLARNPTLAQMVAAWQAAQARYPQVAALEDPMVMGKLGPAAIGTSGQVHDHFYAVEASQKLPWFGKLALRGDSALAEASAAGRDVEDARLQLAESARTAFYDFYLVARALEVNAENLRLLDEFQTNARDRYKAVKEASQQDILQADVEIGRQRERTLLLERKRKVALARLNTLMHLPPDNPLPPPPKELEWGKSLPDAQGLRSTALARRPDLQALADHVRAEEAKLGLARKEFGPDFEVAAGYDAFWDVRSQRPEVSVRLNLPIYKDKRLAAVAEARARIAERQADLARRTDQVNYEVQQAYEQVRESEQAVRLYQKEIVPAARRNVQAAQADYKTGRLPFVTLIEAERGVIGLQDRYYEIIADYFRRRATLERVVGGPLP
jgi:outer membrane protein TolC